MQTIVRYHPSSFPKGAGKTAIYVHAPQNSLQILMAVINTANFTEACLWWTKLPDQAVKRWAPTAVSCEVATHPSHCWDATAYPVKGKGRSAELCCHVHATVCKRKTTLLKQCSSVCAKITQLHSKSCHGRFYQRTVATNPCFPPWGMCLGDNVPQATTPHMLLGSS